MKYDLIKAKYDDRLTIYQIKKDSIYEYVDDIWGWDEKYQLKDFDDSYIPDNFSKVISNRCCIGFIETCDNDKSINITEIHLIPLYQGFGIGTDIITDIIKQGKSNNKKITLGCFKSNIRAVNLYKRLGFFNIIKETDTHYCFEQ